MKTTSLLKHWPLALAFAILKCVGLIALAVPAWADDNGHQAFHRVMDKGVLRCGYYVFPPVTYRDPNTNELSGFTVDMMNEIGRRADLKIEWAEETNFANWVPGIQNGRYDVACTPNWPDLPMSRVVTFSKPMFYAGLYPMVRSDDARFKGNDLKAFNKEGITFAMTDGDTMQAAVKSRFPKAAVNVMPPGSGNTSYVLEVIGKKADVFLTDQNGKIEFEKAYPGKLRFMSDVTPFKTQPFNLAVNKEETLLNDFMNAAIDDLINDGTMDQLLRKWEPQPGKTYMRVAKPYEVQK